MQIPVRSFLSVFCYVFALMGLSMWLLPPSAFALLGEVPDDEAIRQFAGIGGAFFLIPAALLHWWTVRNVTDPKQRKPFNRAMILLPSAMASLFILSMLLDANTNLTREQLSDQFEHFMNHLAIYAVVILVVIFGLLFVLLNFSTGNRMGKLLAKEQFEQVIAMGEKFKYDNDKLLARINLAFAYIGVKRLEEAQSLIQDLKQVTEYKGQVTEENYKQVLVGLDLKYLEALGKINEAVQRVATIEDTDPIIRSILTGIFIRAKRFEEAQQRIETLKAITTPTPQMPLRNLSQLIQDLQKQYDEAMASPAYPPQTNSRT